MRLLTHVIPIGDLRLHAAQMECPCHPVDVGDNVVAHNAWDTREKRERITGEKCSDGWVLVLQYVGGQSQ